MAETKTTPNELYNPYCFEYKNTSSITMAVTTWVPLTFDTKIHDPMDLIVSSSFTVPFDGIWHFDANCRTGNGNERTITGIFIDGTLVRGSSSADMQGATIVGSLGAMLSTDMKLTSGQVVTVQCYTDDGIATSADANYTYWTGHLVTKL